MERLHTAITADAEKRLLVWIATRLPAGVNSDHLTFMAAAALAGVGACFAAGGPALPFAIPLLALNWFGDSLDGTVARVRRRERPRYGYYVDHVLDAAGVGLLVVGFVIGGHMTPAVGLAFLAAYFLVVIEVSLATTALGTFRLAAWGVGPTELRLALALGTLQLMRNEYITFGGRQWLLFDGGGCVAIGGLLLTFIVSALRNGITLYGEERLR
ncbi:MAG TPA: CDP-alcohol phosphatidyltransferase family protein [Vicinamibacterales bacterium]|jgi:phosphatidylglycerophosphate synthase